MVRWPVIISMAGRGASVRTSTESVSNTRREYRSMDTLLYVSASVALVALACLFVYLMTLINGIRQLLGTVGGSVQSLVAEMGALRVDLQGTIKNMEGIAGQMQVTVERVNGQLDQVEGIVGNVKNATDEAIAVVHSARTVVVHAIEFVDNVQTSVQRPVNEVATVISALGAWIEAFRAKLGIKGGKPAKARPTLQPADETEAPLHRYSDG